MKSSEGITCWFPDMYYYTVMHSKLQELARIYPINSQNFFLLSYFDFIVDKICFWSLLQVIMLEILGLQDTRLIKKKLFSLIGGYRLVWLAISTLCFLISVAVLYRVFIFIYFFWGSKIRIILRGVPMLVEMSEKLYGFVILIHVEYSSSIIIWCGKSI